MRAPSLRRRTGPRDVFKLAWIGTQGLPPRRAVRVPGPVLEPRSAHDGLRHPGRAAADPRDRHEPTNDSCASRICWRSWASTSARCGATRTRSPAASGSGSALRARSRSTLRHSLRRADLGARRFSAGADPEPAEGPADRAGALLPFRLAQSRRRRLHGQRDRRDVPRHHRGAGAARRACSAIRGIPTRSALLAAVPSPTSTIRWNFEQVCGGGFSDPGELAAPVHDRARPDRARP